MKQLGIGQSTGIELGGATGSLANPDNWPRDEVAGRTLQAAIGQADTQVSPLQLACYLGTLMDGGTRYAAHLLYGVREFGSGEMTLVSEAQVLDSCEISSEALSEIKNGMEMVVKDNNLVKSNMASVTREGITVGGKTGTAQNNTDTPNALFVCAAPIREPELIISVVLEQGYGGSYPSLTAARILEQYYGIAD
jgi:penicillin-binding protein 2